MLNGRGNAHLKALETRHREISSLIEREQTHPSASDVFLRKLKRQKLHIKERLEIESRKAASTA